MLYDNSITMNKDSLNEYCQKYIYPQKNSLLLVRRLYFHWSSIYPDIEFPLDELSNNIFKSKPVYVSQFCKWGWLNFKLVRLLEKKNYKPILAWFFDKYLIKSKNDDDKEFVEIREMWKLFKVVIDNKSYHNKYQFYNTIYSKYSKYCLFKTKHIPIGDNYDNLNLEEKMKLFIKENIITGNTFLSFRDVWNEFKGFFPKDKLRIKERQIFAKNLEIYLNTNSINYKKRNNRILSIKKVKFKYSVNNYLPNLVYLINFSLIRELQDISIDYPNIKYNPNINDINRILKIEKNPVLTKNYFHHKEIYDFAHKPSLAKVCLKLLNIPELRYIDYRDNRPLCFKYSGNCLRLYGEFSERVIYNILLRRFPLSLNVSNICDNFNIPWDIIKMGLTSFSQTSSGVSSERSSDLTSIIAELLTDVFNIQDFSLTPEKKTKQFFPWKKDDTIKELNLLYNTTYAILNKIIKKIYLLKMQPQYIYENFIIRPDLIINDTVFDIKEVQYLGDKDMVISLQLWIYYGVLRCLGYSISKIGIIAPGKGMIVIFDLSSLTIKPEDILNNLSNLVFKTKNKFYDVPKLKNHTEQEEFVKGLIGGVSTNLIDYKIYIYNNDNVETFEGLI